MLKLVLPNIKYKSSFYSYLDELQKENRVSASNVKVIKPKDYTYQGEGLVDMASRESNMIEFKLI